MTLKGSCLCGAVRYEVDRLDTSIGHCHCRTCRKSHAAPYAPTARVMRDHFHLIAGGEKLAAFFLEGIHVVVAFRETKAPAFAVPGEIERHRRQHFEEILVLPLADLALLAVAQIL